MNVIHTLQTVMGHIGGSGKPKGMYRCRGRHHLHRYTSITSFDIPARRLGRSNHLELYYRSWTRGRATNLHHSPSLHPVYQWTCRYYVVLGCPLGLLQRSLVDVVQDNVVKGSKFRFVQFTNPKSQLNHYFTFHIQHQSSSHRPG
jgi:hypothetical protein